jgi:integrase
MIVRPRRLVESGFAFTKTRYRGIAKNVNHLQMLFASANWLMRARAVALTRATAHRARPRNRGSGTGTQGCTVPTETTLNAGSTPSRPALALTPVQVASPLASRPYDLRHAAVSTWLNAGVPAAEIAERAGHSVEVLTKVYAKCVDGQRDAMNERIAAMLGDTDS